MAKLDTVNIDMLEIHQKVKASTDADTNISLNDSDIRGLAAPDATYAGSDGIDTRSGFPISIGEFRNGEHTSLDSFPNISGWDVVNSRTIANNTIDIAQAFCQINFRNIQNQNRIEITYSGGTNASMATLFTTYMNYSGFSGDIKVKYTTDSSQNSGVVLSNTNDGNYYGQPKGWPGNTQNPAISGSMPITNSQSRKVSGTNFTIPTNGAYLPFEWFVEGPPWTSGGNISNGFDQVIHAFKFTISFVSDDNVPYSEDSVTKYVELYAGRGPLIL